MDRPATATPRRRIAEPGLLPAEWLARTAVKTSAALAVISGFCAVFITLTSLQSVRDGTGAGAWSAAAAAFAACFVLLVISRWIASRMLARHLGEPTRQLLLADLQSRNQPVWAAPLYGLGLLMVSCASIALIAFTALLQDNWSSWRFWLLSLAAVLPGFAGIVAIGRSRMRMVKDNRRVLFDIRPVVVLLGALTLRPMQDEESVDDGTPFIMDSQLGQLVRMLRLIGPVVMPDHSGVRRYGAGAAIVATTSDSHPRVVRTLIASARLTVVVLTAGTRAREDLEAAAHAGPGDGRLVILIPAKSTSYQQTRQSLPYLGLPPIAASVISGNGKCAFSAAVCRSGDHWVVRELAAKTPVTQLGLFINSALDGFSDTLPARTRCVGLRTLLHMAWLGCLGIAIALAGAYALGALGVWGLRDPPERSGLPCPSLRSPPLPSLSNSLETQE